MEDRGLEPLTSCMPCTLRRRWNSRNIQSRNELWDSINCMNLFKHKVFCAFRAFTVHEPLQIEPPLLGANSLTDPDSEQVSSLMLVFVAD